MSRTVLKATNEEDFEKFTDMFIQDKKKYNFNERMEQVMDLIKKGEWNSAYNNLAKMCSELENGIVYENDENYAIFSFNSEIEFFLEIVLNKKAEKKDKSIQWIGLGEYSYPQVYYYMAYVCIELGNYNKAKTALDKALLWNPVSADIYLEYADILLREKNYDSALTTTLKALSLATTPDILAHCYRKLGFCYTDMGNYQLSVALHVHSLYFENNDTAINELEYIASITNNDDIFDIRENDVEKLLTENNIPLEVSDMVFVSYYKILSSYENNPQENLVERFKTLIKNLKLMTYDQEKRAILDKIRIPQVTEEQ